MARMAPSQEDRYKPPLFKRVDDHIVEESDMLAHEFQIGFQIDGITNPGSDVNRNLQAWLKTDPGQWILEHCVEEPYIVWYENPMYGGYTYRMMARLRKQDQTFFKMKFK
jgi:hypothetical protein